MCTFLPKVTFIKNEPKYGPIKLPEGKGQQDFFIGHIYEVKIIGIT